MLFRSKLGIVNARMLSKQRKYAILLIFVAAAILTPSPDALSQILMALPLLFLYEVSIVIARFVSKKTPAPETQPQETVSTNGEE